MAPGPTQPDWAPLICTTLVHISFFFKLFLYFFPDSGACVAFLAWTINSLHSGLSFQIIFLIKSFSDCPHLYTHKPPPLEILKAQALALVHRPWPWRTGPGPGTQAPHFTLFTTTPLRGGNWIHAIVFPPHLDKVTIPNQKLVDMFEAGALREQVQLSCLAWRFIWDGFDGADGNYGGLHSPVMLPSQPTPLPIYPFYLTCPSEANPIFTSAPGGNNLPLWSTGLQHSQVTVTFCRFNRCHS